MSEGTSTFSAAANLAKLCIGVGVLALPYATSVGGLLFAPLVIAVVASWNAVACSKMVECKDACNGMDFPAHLSSTYSKIAYAGAGEIGVIVTDVSIIVTLIGVCIAYQITFAQLLQQIPWTNFDTTTLSTAFAFLALPLCCVPNIGVLAVFSLIGLVCLVVSVVAIIVYGVLLYGSAAWEQPFSHVSFGGHDNHLSAIVNDSHKHLPLWPENLSSMSSFIGVATFCFGLCSLAFPVLESMRDKRQFGTAVFWSLLFVWFVYVLLGDVGALLYVEAAAGIRDNILSNLPTDSFVALLVRLAMTAVSLLTYPLTLVPPAQMLEHYMLSFAAKTAGPATAPALLSRDSAKGAYGAVELADIETETETAETTALNTPVRDSEDSLSSRDSAACASLEISQSGRILTRALMVISTTFIATCIPCFGIVIALLGGFTVTILSFVLPSYLHLQIVGYQCTADQTRCRHDENRRRSRVPFSKADPPAGSDDWELEIGGTEAVSGEASRARVMQEDLALTAAGVLLCVVATTVTTMGFLSRVGGEGAQC